MLKIFGPRLVIKPVTETYDGLVVLPPGVARNNHIIGEIVGVGDGRMPDGKVLTTELKPGDVVMLQANQYVLQAAVFRYKDGDCLNLHWNDMIIKLSSRTVKLSTVSMLGRWSLVESFTTPFKNSPIILPGNLVDTSEFTRYRMVKVGPDAGIDVAPGDEVIVDKGRINVLQIDNKPYFYVSSEFLLGVVFDQ